VDNQSTVASRRVSEVDKISIDANFDGLTLKENEQVLQAEKEFKAAKEKYEATAHLRKKRSDFIFKKRMAARSKSKPSRGGQSQSSKNIFDEFQTFLSAVDAIRKRPRTSYAKPPNKMDDLPRDQLVKLFQRSETLDTFAASLGVPRRQSIARLKAAGVDLFENISLEWENGTSLRKLGKKYSVMPQTISNWIKSTGREIKPRNSNKRYDTEQIIAHWEKGWSPNKIAIHLSLSWATVQKAINNKK